MKNISSLLIVTMLTGMFAMTGCGNRNDVERDNISFDGLNSEEVLGGEDGKYADLTGLLGNITYGQLLELLDGSLKKLNALDSQGYTTRQDYQTLYVIINNMHTMLLENEKQHESNGEENTSMAEASQALSELIQMAAEMKVGTLLNQIIAKTGPNVLKENIYPMLTYALAADDATLKGALSGVTIGKFKDYADFKTTMDIANGLLDPNGKYAVLHDDIIALLNTAKSNEIKGLTFKDAKDLVQTLLDAINSTNTEESTIDPKLVEQAANALVHLWDTDPQFRADLITVLSEAGKLMGHKTGGETDLSRVLAITEQLLSPANRPYLRQFVNSSLHGIAPVSDAQTIEGLIETIAGRDWNNDDILDDMNTYPEEIGKGLIEAVARNMYDQDRATTDVKTSSLRSLMFMMQEANHAPYVNVNIIADNIISQINDAIRNFNNFVNNNLWWLPGWLRPQVPTLPSAPSVDMIALVNNTINAMNNSINTMKSVCPWPVNTWIQWPSIPNIPQPTCMRIYLLDKICSPDGTVSNQTINMAEWTIGEVVTALDNHPNMTPTQAFHWLLYQKTYRFLGLPLPGLTQYNGISDMMNNNVVQTLMPVNIIDAFPSFKGLERHNLIALFAPLMRYFWYNNRAQDMIDMMVLMNEIGCNSNYNPYISYSQGYTPLRNGGGASFRTDASGVIMKLIEGGDKRDGGLLTYALRSHDSNTNKDGVIFDKALDLIVRIVFELDSQNCLYEGNTTVFNALIAQLNIQKMDQQRIDAIIASLFDGKDGHAPVLDTLHQFIVDNRTVLSTMAEPAGQLLIDLSAQSSEEPTTNLESLVADAKTVWPIISGLFTNTATPTTMSDFLAYLTKKNADGSDNTFMQNAKVLAYRIMDVQDSVYNPNGFVTDITPLTGPDGLLTHLLGGTGVIDSLKELIGMNTGQYDLSPAFNFLVAATSRPDILWSAMEDGGNMLGQIMGDEQLSMSFVRTLVNPVDSNNDGVLETSVLYDIFGMVHLDGVDMNGVLNDVSTLFAPGNTDLTPDSAAFKQLNRVLEFVLKNTAVN